MNLIEIPDSMSDKIVRLLQPVLVIGGACEPASREDAWQGVLDRLSEWQRDPGQLEDEGVEPPTFELVTRAREVADVLRSRAIETPDRLLVNGDGGIVFRWRLNDRQWSIELDRDESIEATLMCGGNLVWRHSLHEVPAGNV